MGLGVATMSTTSGGFGGGLKFGSVFSGNVPGPIKPCFILVSCSCVCVLTTVG